MQNTFQRPAEASGSLTLGGDLKVNRLGFGAMRITGEGIWGPPKDKQEALAVVRRTLDLGINLIDTADSYGPEVSEELIAEALYPYPQALVIATKGGLLRTGPGQWPLDGSPEHLRMALEGSLRRLRLDHIDIYQLHRPDPKIPLEDSIGALVRLKEEGKIRHIGISNVKIDELIRAQKIAPIVTVQNHYNLSNRKSERMSMHESEEIIDLCEQQGIGFIPWSPLTTGELAYPGGKLEEIARKHNAKINQIVIAWMLKRSRTMLPIPGTSTVQHLEENVQSATIELSDEEFARIDQISLA